MTTQATTQKSEARSKRKSVVLLSLAVGATLSAVAALGGTARDAEAALTEKVVFISDRSTGPGVDNPTRDYEVFKMNPDGTGLRQLTFNEVEEEEPTLSPNGMKIAYKSEGVQTSNPQGDYEVYVMNALDGSAKKNLSNNGDGVHDGYPHFSSDSKKIAYESEGIQTSNPQGDWEVYVMNASDGKGKKNLTNNGSGVEDRFGEFSPNSSKIAYMSSGVQNSNPQGDREVYVMNASDGKGKKNLSNNGAGTDDSSLVFSPGGAKIAYQSNGIQPSNPEGDYEVYAMNALDGSAKKNLSNNGADVGDDDPVFSPGGKKIAYESQGKQISNEDGDPEIYRMSALDGSAKKNLTNNGLGISDRNLVFSPDGAKIAYESNGAQPSNLDGDDELYRMNTLDGLGQKNLSDNTDGDYSPAWGVQAP